MVEFGALWDPENERTLRRTTEILKAWFNPIRVGVSDWWDLGAGPGGGLAMNDGVVALVGVLRSVLAHLRDNKRLRLTDIGNKELTELVLPYAQAVGGYLASLSPEQRRQFRELRGVQGVTTRQRRIQQALRGKTADFNPAGLEDFLRNEKAETNKRAKEFLDKIEILLQTAVISELKQQYGPEDSGWWFRGVPAQVRKEVSSRLEEDAGKRGGKENYFDLIHYRSIITFNWQLFGEQLAYGKKNVGKDKGTDWIQEMNECRKVVAHPTSGVHISMEELAGIAHYHGWLTNRIENPDADESALGESTTGTGE